MSAFVKKNNAIFIHSLWRSGSTYFWSKFRKNSSLNCYYEPYNTSLSKISLNEIKSIGPSSWDSGHPDGPPYFLEYQGLVESDGGIRGFHRDLSVNAFFPEGSLSTTDKSYIATLLGHSKRAHKESAFGFCRSLGKVGAMRNEFGGVHITLIRGPFSLLNSTLRVSFLADYFEIVISKLGKNTLREWGFDQDILDKVGQLNGSTEIFDHISKRDIYRFVLKFWSLMNLSGSLYSDIVIDIERISHSHLYRLYIEKWLKYKTGLVIDLTDCRPKDSVNLIDCSLEDADIIRRSTLQETFNDPSRAVRPIIISQGCNPVRREGEVIRSISRIYQRSEAEYFNSKAKTEIEI